MPTPLTKGQKYARITPGGNHKEEGVRYRWALSAYLIEVLTIWGALAVGRPGWSVAVALGGISVHFALWRLAPQLSTQEGAATA